MLDRAPKRNRLSVREELGAGNDVVVLQTSRFEEWKGHRLLLEALLELRGLPWRLWLAGAQTRPGERRLRNELEKMASRHGLLERVTFLGDRNDVPDLLGAADLFCQPNLEREPYGIGILEAMAMGLPIVATDLGATSVQISGDWGRAVPVSTKALTVALAELITNEDRRRELGARASEMYRQRFSIAPLVAEMNTALGEVASEGRGR
jgi:glycosyltransferase involved in cell wall biosynthesis